MASGDILWLGLLAMIIGAILAFYALRLRHEGRALLKALRALRDRLDGTRRWP
jgi:hypothetical protein